MARARTQGRAHRRAGTCSVANLAGGAPGTITRPQCGRGGIGRRDGLDGDLSALPGNRRCRTAQIRGNLSNGNPEPSPADGREGVETRRAAPKAFGQGEGIVQTTNPASSGAAKAVAGKKIRLPQGSGGSSPPARTKPPWRSDLLRVGVSHGAHVEPDRRDLPKKELEPASPAVRQAIPRGTPAMRITSTSAVPRRRIPDSVDRNRKSRQLSSWWHAAGSVLQMLGGGRFRVSSVTPDSVNRGFGTFSATAYLHEVSVALCTKGQRDADSGRAT